MFAKNFFSKDTQLKETAVLPRSLHCQGEFSLHCTALKRGAGSKLTRYFQVMAVVTDAIIY